MSGVVVQLTANMEADMKRIRPVFKDYRGLKRNV